MSDACPGNGNGLFSLYRVDGSSEAASLDTLHTNGEEAAQPRIRYVHTLPNIPG